MRSTPSLAAMATIPSRGHLLERVLPRLRSQFECLALYCGKYTEVPQVVKDLADFYQADPADTLGSEGKLAWTEKWRDNYYCVDDDILYPEDYRERMERELDLWEGRVICTIQGARFPQTLNTFSDPKVQWMRWNKSYSNGMWLSMPAGCFTCFNTKLHVPGRWPEHNADDHQIAVWAQQHMVPIWGTPHQADWCQYLLPKKDKAVYSIFREEKKTGFERRNRILSAVHRWKLYSTSPIQ